MFSGAMPNSPAKRTCAIAMPWLGVSMIAVAIPLGDDGMRLNRVVILRRGLIDRFDALRRRGKSGRDIPARLGRRADAHRRRDKAPPASSATRGLEFHSRRKERCAFRRSLQCIGDDDGDGLVRVANAIILQQIHLEMKGVLFSSGWMASEGTLAGVITSTTPG